MAETKKVTTPKNYPEEAKTKLTALLEETKEARSVLDSIDTALHSASTPSMELVKEWARKSQGWGNYMRKKLAKLSAAAINEKGNRYMEIKLECNSLGITFADGAAKQEAEAYIAPLRSVRDIFEAYVTSADNVVSVVRLHIKADSEEQNHEVQV